jgi:CheY-specific phosphatase CheX
MISEEVEAAFMARMTDPGCHIDVTPPTVNEPLPPEVAYHGEPDQR